MTKTVLRQRRNSNFTVIDNLSAQDDAMSWKATGLWVYMLTMPDDWHFNQTDLARRKTDGVASTRAGMDELEQLGYIRKLKERNEDGTISRHVIEVRDSLSTPWSPECDYPQMGNPQMDNPLVENRTLQKTHSTENTGTKNPVDQSKDLSKRDQVWDAYLKACREFNGGKGRTPVYSNARKQLIDRRLANYPVEDLVLAVTGWVHSSFHTGDNDQGKVYNSIDLILRNDEKIELFISYHDVKKPTPMGDVNSAHGREHHTSSDIIEIDDEEDFLE